MKRAVLALIALVALSSGCSRLFGNPLAPTDSVIYRVVSTSTGANTATLAYATPSGTVQATVNLQTAPFESPAVAGFGQGSSDSPAITVTVTGCAQAFIVRNGSETAKGQGCGTAGVPSTFTVK